MLCLPAPPCQAWQTPNPQGMLPAGFREGSTDPCSSAKDAPWPVTPADRARAQGAPVYLQGNLWVLAAGGVTCLPEQGCAWSDLAPSLVV